MKEWDTESPAACLIVINLLSVKQGIHNLEVKWDSFQYLYLYLPQEQCIGNTVRFLCNVETR